jgi:hypothetical protein
VVTILPQLKTKKITSEYLRGEAVVVGQVAKRIKSIKILLACWEIFFRNNTRTPLQTLSCSLVKLQVQAVEVPKTLPVLRNKISKVPNIPLKLKDQILILALSSSKRHTPRRRH